MVVCGTKMLLVFPSTIEFLRNRRHAVNRSINLDLVEPFPGFPDRKFAISILPVGEATSGYGEAGIFYGTC